MISDPKAMNKQQTVLREAIKEAQPHEQAIQLCLNQHALLHSAKVTSEVIWSYEDEVLDDLDEVIFRRIPKNEEHSIVWCIWHLARIEDTAMNFLVANEAPIYEKENWFEKLQAPFQDTGNEMTIEDIQALSAEINLQTLRDYRVAVGKRSQEIIGGLSATELTEKVDPNRIQKVLDAGAILPKSSYITDYWSKRDIRGLLLMPATRHNLVHLNEAARLKRKRA
jgi:hypothetical protein